MCQCKEFGLRTKNNKLWWCKTTKKYLLLQSFEQKNYGLSKSY